MERAKLITAEEAQSILDVCETMASVAAQMGLTTLLMGGDEPSLMDAIPGLARTVKALHAEVARLGAIIEGRTTPPTDAEIDAHERVGGVWIIDHAEGPAFARFREDARLWQRGYPGKARRWLPIDRDGRPCAWPVVSQ